MDFAYIRATNGKDLDYQHQLMKSFGYTDWESEKQGGYLGRKTFDAILGKLRPKEDTIIVANISVLPYPTMRLIEFVSWLNDTEIKLKVLEGDIHLPTIVELRNHSRKRRVQTATESFKGVRKGRTKGALSEKEQMMAKASAYMYETKYKEGNCSIGDILAECGYAPTDKPKLYRHLETMGVKKKAKITENE